MEWVRICSAAPIAPISGQYSALVVVPDGGFREYCVVWCTTYLAPPPQGPLLAEVPTGSFISTQTYMSFMTYIDSWLGQSFTANAGDVLSFEWRWFSWWSTEIPVWACVYTGSDCPVFTLQGPSNFIFYSSNRFDAALIPPGYVAIPFSSPALAPPPPSETGFIVASEVATFAFALPSSGEWTLWIGAVQPADNISPAGVLVDNVRLTAAVPEPASLALVFFALSMLGCVRRKLH